MKVVHHHSPEARAERETHHRRASVRTWVATGLTFAAVVALWALLLPKTYSGLQASMVDVPAWLRDKSESANLEGLFDSASLDRLEASLRDDTDQRRAKEAADDLKVKFADPPPAEPAAPTMTETPTPTPEPAAESR